MIQYLVNRHCAVLAIDFLCHHTCKKLSMNTSRDFSTLAKWRTARVLGSAEWQSTLSLLLCMYVCLCVCVDHKISCSQTSSFMTFWPPLSWCKATVRLSKSFPYKFYFAVCGGSPSMKVPPVVYRPQVCFVHMCHKQLVFKALHNVEFMRKK